MRSALFLTLACACGRVGFAPRDAHALDGPPPDSAFAPTSEIYIKASNTDPGDQFGASFALSADGTTLAVGAPFEASASAGIDGNQADNSAVGAGAVYVFVRAGATWVQQAYVKASTPVAEDLFGWAIALSADGNTLAIGAFDENSGATGIDGNQADSSAPQSGAVYIYARAGTTWTQQAYIKASNTGSNANFGAAIALTSDGNTLAVGARFESSDATGIDGNQADASASSAGAVYTFTRTNATWTQQAYVKASNTDAGDNFGWSVALSPDGGTLAVGAMREASAATGVGGDQADNSASGSGAVYVFVRAGATWTQQTYLKASDTFATENFGCAVTLAMNGDTLAVGAVCDDSAATHSGTAFVFVRAGTIWAQQAALKASNSRTGDGFDGVALSTDGNTLAVGASGDSSAATGVGGDPTDTSAPSSGATFVLVRTDVWTQQDYVKASNTRAGAQFGAPAFSSDGSTLVIAAPNESSAATGVDGDQTDTSAPAAGAIYVLH